MNDDKRITRIEDKVDKIIEKISSIDVTLAAQHVSLKDHIRRTEILEKEMKPVKKHAERVKITFGLIGGVSVVLGIIETVLKLLGKS